MKNLFYRTLDVALEFAVIIDDLICNTPDNGWSDLVMKAIKEGWVKDKVGVTIVGSNPSESSPDCSPFHPRTRSRLILDDWFKGATVEYTFVNVINQKTENNRQLTVKQIKEALPSLRQKIKTEKVVALGKTAEKALTLMGIGFCTMPHPSGLNRQLNDPEFVRQEVAKLHAYLTSS